MNAPDVNITSMLDVTTYSVRYLEEPGTGVDQGLVSDDVCHMFELVCYVILNGLFGVLGSVANCINIAVFIKQGFEDSVNVSFLALSVAEMCSLWAFIWESVCLNPLLIASDTSVSFIDVHYLTSAVPHALFVRTAWWITTFITFERCLCILMPLKVKQVITPRRTVCIIVIIFITTFLAISPSIIASRLQPTWFPVLNRTVLTRVYIDDGLYIESIGFMCVVVSQFGAFITDVICTMVIVILLQSKSKWRHAAAKTSSSASTKEGLSGRDKKVVKMVTLISIIFIVCLTPSCVNFIVSVVLSPGYTLIGVQHNLYNVVWTCILTLEAIHSSINIFVYYNMSTKFRMTFSEMFCWSFKDRV